MVDLLLGPLYPVRQPLDDVIGFVAKNRGYVFKPPFGLFRIPQFDGRRPVEVETTHAPPLNPAAVRDQAISDHHWLARRPGHLFDGPVLVEPCARRQRLVANENRRNPRVHAARRPHFSGWSENVSVRRHVSEKVVNHHAYTGGRRRLATLNFLVKSGSVRVVRAGKRNNLGRPVRR